jgi:F-type H+-transporting ATPase subunit b
MINVDLSLVLQIILFLIFWAILRRILFAPMARLMEEREKRTDGVQEQARAMLEEGKQLQAKYEAAIAKARAEGESIKSEIRAEAARARELIVAQGYEAATQTSQNMRAEIHRELEEARKTIVQEAESLAYDMAEKVLGRKVA